MAFLDEKIPPVRALFGIFFSILFVAGLATMGWLYYLHVKTMRAHDSQYRIVAIVQTSPQKETLKTGYLAELLGLSVDQPTNLYQLDREAAETKLKDSPLIRQATVKKIRPGTLYIDYQIRTPVAYLGDYTNTALDAQGVLIPFAPFFTPKRLPTIYLGLHEGEKKWGEVLEDERMKVAFEIMEKAQACCTKQELLLKQVDVSKVFADSYGQRQVVMAFEESAEESQPLLIIARMNSTSWQKNLDQLFLIRSHLADTWKGSVVTIDLRISHLAFIKND